MHAQGLFGDRRGHKGIAVPVTAHPGTEGKEAWQRKRMSGGKLLQGIFKFAVERRNDVEQHVIEVVEPVIHLAQDGGTFPGRYVCLRQNRDNFMNVLVGAPLYRHVLAPALPFGETGPQQLKEDQQRAPPHFRGMPREDRPDREQRQNGSQFFRGDTLALEMRHGSGNRLIPRLRIGRALTLPHAAHAVLFFSRIDEIEIERECPGNRKHLARLESGNRIGQRLERNRCGSRPLPDRAQPYVLYKIQQRLTVLLLEHLTEHSAKILHVFAQLLDWHSS